MAVLQKSIVYNGVRFFEYRDTTFFKKSTSIILKVDFNNTPDSDFETEYLNPILECNYCSKYLNENFYTKVEICLNMLSKHIFQWMAGYFIFDDNYNNSPSEFITKQYYRDNPIMSCEYSRNQGLPEKRIHLSYYNCGKPNQKKIQFSIKEIGDRMKKSTLYTGQKKFKATDTNYFKDKAYVLLEVNFDSDNFEKVYLDTILKHAYNKKTPVMFKSYDEKVEHCLRIITQWIFEWLKDEKPIKNTSFKSLEAYINEKYGVCDILSYENDKVKKDIHVEYSKYDDNLIRILLSGIELSNEHF